MVRDKLNPKSKRIRQKIMHRTTRPLTDEQRQRFEEFKPLVHAAITTALKEEIDRVEVRVP